MNFDGKSDIKEVVLEIKKPSNLGLVFITSMPPDDFKIVSETLKVIDKDAGKALVELCKRYNRFCNSEWYK